MEGLALVVLGLLAGLMNNLPSLIANDFILFQVSYNKHK